MTRLVHRLLVAIVNALEGWLVRHPRLYRVLLADRFTGLRRRVGAWRAWTAFERAYGTVPAYRQFIDRRGGPPALRCRGGVPDLSVIPQTDKASYVRRHSHADRCRGGAIPSRGVVVDESSGSSGSSTSWVRGPEERRITKHVLQLAYRSALGDRSLFVINAFALGAWATGLNVTLSLNDISIMKSTGPDIDKIVATIDEFGPDHDYVVMGYPPFLKTLADCDRIAWQQHDIRAVFGGEAMSESLRDYLLRRFSEVLGSYGASDLQIALASESRFTVGLRRTMRQDGELRDELADPRHGTLPMVFQYDPVAYHLETTAEGELVVTLSRPTTTAPKIRYNIHDLGHAVPFATAASALRRVGRGALIERTDPARLPLLFLYGRSDGSVDYYGAKISADSVREILFSMPRVAPVLDGFRLIAREDRNHDKQLRVALELTDGTDPGRVEDARIADELFGRLAEVNRDFHNAYRNTATADQLPELSVHAHDTGPFAGPDGIKRTYVAGGPRYDEL